MSAVRKEISEINENTSEIDEDNIPETIEGKGINSEVIDIFADFEEEKI